MGNVLTIDPNSPVDPSEQLYLQIRRQIVIGIRRPGERLETVQSVANQLRLSPKTVERSYRRLKDEGLTESATAQGTTVVQPPRAAIVAEATRFADAAVEQLRQLELSHAEAQELFKSVLGKWYPRGDDRRRAGIRAMTVGADAERRRIKTTVDRRKKH